MLLSHRCQYALRLALFLARRPPGARVPVAALSDELGAPQAFLSKVAQDLVHADVLTSKRGPGGGVALARDAGAIVLLDVVEAVDGGAVFETCVLGLPGCGDLAPCPLHAEWAATRAELRDRFASTALTAAVAAADDRAFRLAPPPE